MTRFLTFRSLFKMFKNGLIPKFQNKPSKKAFFHPINSSPFLNSQNKLISKQFDQKWAYFDELQKW